MSISVDVFAKFIRTLIKSYGDRTVNQESYNSLIEKAGELEEFWLTLPLVKGDVKLEIDGGRSPIGRGPGL